MPAPSIPGIYVMSLLCEDWVPVTRDERYVATCARVNSLNVKVGKAKNFSVRERDYWADFGQQNVLFIPVVRTDRIREAETAVLRELSTFRKRSPKGGRMDWLENIDREAVISGIFRALTLGRIQHEPLL